MYPTNIVGVCEATAYLRKAFGLSNEAVVERLLKLVTRRSHA
ncbi:MAG: hypothetical protein HW388_1031 [Dehalococcoidia bacterium]|nr:hypothetical protein [Dehalococcoidia bacterium]